MGEGKGVPSGDERAAPTGALAGASAAGAGIAIEGVELAYGSTVVLRDVSLLIAPGEFFALLGPSGSGKSTLLRLLAGFNRADRGRVLIDGVDMAALPPWKRDVGMVFQNYALWPHMTVAENVAFGLEERHWPRERVRERVREMLELVDLAGYDARRPGQLSGGQQQRVAIARTLAIAPSVLLLDEPLSNLDAKLRAATGLELKRLQRRLGLTTVFVTHDQQEAMTIADRLAVLEHGTIQQVGTPRELYDAPANRFVAEFVGSINLYPGRVETADAHTCVVAVAGLGRVCVPARRVAASIARAGAAVAIAFRPHAVRPAPAVPMAPASTMANPCKPDQGNAGLAFDATIGIAEFLGEFVRYELAVNTLRVVADLPHARFAETLAPGARARFAVPPDEILVLGER
jgi:iron(III) transport system ATP-binding protein